MNLWLNPSNNIKKKLVPLYSHLTLLQSRWHTAITRLPVNTHCFRTGVEKVMELCTALQEGCGYKDTLSAHRYFVPSAKYFTVCITYQPPSYYYSGPGGNIVTPDSCVRQSIKPTQFIKTHRGWRTVWLSEVLWFEFHHYPTQELIRPYKRRDPNYEHRDRDARPAPLLTRARTGTQTQDLNNAERSAICCMQYRCHTPLIHSTLHCSLGNSLNNDQLTAWYWLIQWCI